MLTRRTLRKAALITLVAPWILLFLIMLSDPKANPIGLVFFIPLCAMIALALFVASFFVNRD